MNLILNRNFELPADGWYQLAPLGEFPHTAAGIIQVIDAAACTAMVAAFDFQKKSSEIFPGLLIDFDHFSLDSGKRSEAAGWITDLKFVDIGSSQSAIGNRQSEIYGGLYAKIRWSDVGEAAVSGGRYRFLSPVWATADCEALRDNRFRPIRLLNAAVTNDPNLKGILPLSNSRTGAPEGRPPFDFIPLNEKTNCPARKEKTMNPILEALLNKLNLPADTAEPDILTAVVALRNRAEAAESELSGLKTAQLEADADAFIEAHAAVIENRDATRAQFIENRTLTEAVFKNLKKPASAQSQVPSATASPKPLHNRDSKLAATQNRDASASESTAVKIRNRAAEIMKTERVAYTEAFRRAEQEFSA